MRLADRIHMLYHQSQAKKRIHGLYFTPTEDLICTAVDEAMAALRKEVKDWLAEKQHDDARDQE